MFRTVLQEKITVLRTHSSRIPSEISISAVLNLMVIFKGCNIFFYIDASLNQNSQGGPCTKEFMH